jgi:hypothetical protein
MAGAEDGIWSAVGEAGGGMTPQDEVAHIQRVVNTWDHFSGQMQRLTGLRFPPADMRTHWEALRDLSASALEAAVSHAQKTRAEFPTPVELRQDADIAARPPIGQDTDRGVDLPVPREVPIPSAGLTVRMTREWRYYCDRCSDCGWESLWCGDEAQSKPWQMSWDCGRHGDHAAHEWVRKCSCWETNPALIRKRENQRKYADAAQTRKKQAA